VNLLAAPAAVAVAVLLARLAGADEVAAALLLLTAVVLCALLGRLPGVLAAVLAAISLNLLFIAPTQELSLGSRDDIIGLIVFTVIAVTVATLVTRERAARRTASLGEQEARLRVEVTDQLLGGTPSEEVLAAAAGAIADMFDLASCRLTATGIEATAHRDRREGQVVTVRTDEATVVAHASANQPLDSTAEDMLAALVSSLGLVFARAEMERATTEARLVAEVNRARAAFFAAAGHNLRTPLASVTASVSTLLDSRELLDDRQEHQLLETIRDETDRLARMVSKVLAQSRARGTDLRPDRQPIDLEGMVQVAVGRLGPAAADHHIDLDIPAELGPLWLDVTMLEQILLNLLENAVRYSPGDAPITVTAHRGEHEIDLRVIDRGPGVPADEHVAIFDEFYRSGARTEEEGTGLGLAIVRAMVAAQDGRVWCEDTPGGGATFVVRFPLGAPPDDEPGSESAGAPPRVGPDTTAHREGTS
jgi:two-component system sensor histidine kinase KdpD